MFWLRCLNGHQCSHLVWLLHHMCSCWTDLQIGCASVWADFKFAYQDHLPAEPTAASKLAGTSPLRMHILHVDFPSVLSPTHLG